MKLSFLLGLITSVMLLGAGCQGSVPPSPSSSSITIPAQAVLSNTYTNETYGFSFKYPEAVQVFEQGPNDAEKEYEAKKMISGTIQPLLNRFEVKRKSGETLMVIQVPNHQKFPIFTGKYEWNKRACGNEGFSGILSEKPLRISDKEAFQVVSEDPEVKIKDTYTCIASMQPVIIVYTEVNREIAESIISTLSFKK